MSTCVNTVTSGAMSRKNTPRAARNHERPRQRGTSGNSATGRSTTVHGTSPCRKALATIRMMNPTAALRNAVARATQGSTSSGKTIFLT